MTVKMKSGIRCFILFYLALNLHSLALEAEGTKGSFNIAICGEVVNSRVISVDGPITLGAALKICGGLTNRASTRLIYVSRISTDGSRSLMLASMRNELNKDLALQNGDMIMVENKVYWNNRKLIDERINHIVKTSTKSSTPHKNVKKEESSQRQKP